MVRAAIVLFLLALVPSAAVAQAEKRFALLIGNQAYNSKVGRLKNPHDDVALVGAALKQLGFQVTILNDADYRAMDVAIKRFVTEVRSKGKDTISFFYYSGHGAANPETQINYLIPVDISDPNDGNLWYQSFQQNDVIDKLSKQAPNATHYVVFDACRNELNLSGPAAKAIGAEKGFVPVPQTPGLLIAYATAQGKTAADVGDNGGPYARALAAELVKPGIEAVTMFRNVQIRVREDIGQDPWLSFPALPTVYLAGQEKPTSPPMVNPAATPIAPVRLSEAAEAWDRTKDATSVVALEAFIRRFGDTYYGDLANARLEEIKRGRVASNASPGEHPDLMATDCQSGHATDVVIRACSDIIARYPTLAMAYAVRGNAYRVQNNKENALADFGKALELDPTNTFALARRSMVFQSAGEDAKEQVDFERLIAISPTRSIDFESLGFAYANIKKDYDRAIAEYNRAIELDPKRTITYLDRGNVYRNKKDYDRAIIDYDKAIELAPKYAIAYFNRGLAYGDKKDYDRAITDHTKAIELDPILARAYNGRGYAYRNKGDNDRAIADYRKAIELDPNNKYASDALKRLGVTP